MAAPPQERAGGLQDPQLAELVAGGFHVLAKVECGAPAGGGSALPGLLLERASKLQSDRQQGSDALMLGATATYLYIKCLGECCAGHPLELHTCGGSIFSGNAFEAHAGRSARKRWRETIRVLPQNISLRAWLASAVRDSSAAGRPDRPGASSTTPNVALLEAAAAAVAAAAAAAADPLQLQPRAMHLQSLNPEVIRLLEQALSAVAAGQSSIGSGSSGGSGAAPAGTPSQLLPTRTGLTAQAAEAGDRQQQQQQGAQEAAAAIAAALLQGFQEQLMASAEQLEPCPRQGGGQAAQAAASAQLDMRPLLQAVTTLLESSWPGNLTVQQAGPAVARQQQQQQQQHHHQHHHHLWRQAEHPPAAAKQHAVRPQHSMPSSIPQEACRLTLLEQRVQRQQEAIDSQGAQLARVQQQLQSLFFALLAGGGDVGQGAQSAPQQATATAPPPGHHEQAAAPLAAAAEALPAQGRPARSGGRGKGEQAARKSGSAQPAATGATPQLAALSVVPETGSAPLHERALHEQSPTTPAGAGTASPCTAACAAALLPSRGSGASANTSVQLASEQGSGAVPGGEATGHDGSIRKRARHGGSPKAHAPEQSGKAVTGH
ncbi:hypothetical protein ABPG77_010162 [Micractinium sp. CCAP 211/92]